MKEIHIDMQLVADLDLETVLDDGEYAELKERLIWDQELMDEPDLKKQLRKGLREILEDDRYVSKQETRGIFTRIAEVFAVPQYAAAASFMLAIGLSAVFFLNRSTVDTGELNASPTELVPLLTVRGTDVQNVRISDGQMTVLLVDATPGTYFDYRVTLSRSAPTPEPIWAQSSIQPTYLDALAIALPAGFLSAGRYTITVEGSSSESVEDDAYVHIQDFSFEAVYAR